MVLVDVVVPVPVVDNEAMEGFGVGGGVVEGGGGTKERAFVFPLMGFTGAGGGCWAGIGSGLCGVSGRSPERRCCDCSGVSMARVQVAEVVAASRRADTSVTSGSLEIGSKGSKDTGKWLWYFQWCLFQFHLTFFLGRYLRVGYC